MTKFEHIALWCSQGHDHLVAPEQLARLEGTPCCWCGQPIHQTQVTAGDIQRERFSRIAREAAAARREAFLQGKEIVMARRQARSEAAEARHAAAVAHRAACTQRKELRAAQALARYFRTHELVAAA